MFAAQTCSFRMGIRLSLALLLLGCLLSTRSEAQTPPGDSYLCYVTKKLKLSGVQKTLEDHFRSVLVNVTKLNTVCNPIQTASHPMVHQLGYGTGDARVPGQPKFERSDHLVTDQFGQFVVRLLSPIGLFAPSASVAGVGDPGTVDTTGVDHFQCYHAALAVRSTVVPPPLTVVDDFGQSNLTIGRITKVCTPVNKNGEDPSAPGHVGHWVCRRVGVPRRSFVPRTVSTKNTNFGSAVLYAKSVFELCVPAFMDATPNTTTSTITPTTTTTSTSTSTTTLPCTLSTPCISGCFQDWGDGTIRDTCTHMQWEKKDGADGVYPGEGAVNPSNLHDVDNSHVWAGTCSANATKLCQQTAAAESLCKAQTPSTYWPYGCEQCGATDGACLVDNTAGIGTVWDWVDQLRTTNFAGYGDWRLPTTGGNPSGSSGEVPEIESILLAPYPCGVTGTTGDEYRCIDPIFGPTRRAMIWCATTVDAPAPAYGPTLAWGIGFRTGDLNFVGKDTGIGVRAVRANP